LEHDQALPQLSPNALYGHLLFLVGASFSRLILLYGQGIWVELLLIDRVLMSILVFLTYIRGIPKVDARNFRPGTSLGLIAL
jgi:hypothetical protein